MTRRVDGAEVRGGGGGGKGKEERDNTASVPKPAHFTPSFSLPEGRRGSERENARMTLLIASFVSRSSLADIRSRSRFRSQFGRLGAMFKRF